LLHGGFWRDTAYPEAVPDADGVGDRLEVRRPTYVNGEGPFSDSPGGTFLVLRIHAERWERLYFPMIAAPLPAVVEQDAPASRSRRLASKKTKSTTPAEESGETYSAQLVSLMQGMSLAKSGLRLSEVRTKVKPRFTKKYPGRALPDDVTFNRAYKKYKNIKDTSAE
jgi:hypothetical protein